MKKFTLLFATLLAMSGIAFGQKEPKLLWEREFGEVTESYLQTGVVRTILRVSPKGNTLALSGQVWNIFDKDGNSITKSSDYGITNGLSLADSLINWVGNKDSIIFFNGDYQLAGKIIEKYNQDEYYQIYEVDDGVLIVKNGIIIKYDFNIKELWRYTDSSISSTSPFLNQQSLYQFFVNNEQNCLILSREGKKIIQFKSPQQVEIYHNQDESFWVVTFNYVDPKNNDYAINGFNLSKYDSNGKRLMVLGNQDINTDSETIYNRPIFFPDGSLIINNQIQNPNKLSFIKIDKNGNKKQVEKNMNRSFLFKRNAFNVKMVNDNEFMFVVGNFLFNPDAFTVFGVVNFEDNQAGWTKDINQKDVEICKDGFLSHYNYSDELIFYSIGGTEKWNYKLKPVAGSVLGNSITLLSDDYIYVRQTDTTTNDRGISSLIKIKLSDGKEIWKSPKFHGLYFDEQRNHYLSNQFSQINFIPKLGKVASKFFTYSEKSAGYYAGFSGVDINFRNKTLMTITLEKIEDRNYKSILRKYSTQESYDSSTRCAEKLLLQIESVGKPEDCPSVKLKLTLPKQDGLTYQWQKDGKDLPNVKDAVYDFGESGNYTVTAKDEICQNSVVSNSVKVNIRPLPTAEITTQKSTFCEGDKTTIVAKTNGAFFQWQKDGRDIPNATTSIYEVSQAGDYRVSVRDDKCPQMGYSNIYTIITKPMPEANISTDIKGVIYEPFTVKMVANSGTGLNYQWLKDDAIIPNETTAIYEAKQSGKYNVNVTQNGCTKLSNALTISILIPLANQEEIGEEQVKVYPNPSKGEFKIILPKTLKNADIQLFDTFGREHSLTNIGEQIQANGLTQGIYFLRIQKGEKVVTNKILIE